MTATRLLSGLLGVGALLEIPFGLGLIAIPSALTALILGAPLVGVGLIVARLAGGGLLALGIACWFARPTPASHPSVGVAIGLLIYNVVACVTLVLALPGIGNQALALGAAVLHGLLGAGLAGALVVVNRRAHP